MYNLFLLPLGAKGVRGLGKHLPVISSIRRNTEKTETYRIITLIVLPWFIESGTLVISSRAENDLLVVKDHGNTDFVNPSRVRSRRKHRFCEKTRSISSIGFLFVIEKENRSDGNIRYGVAERDLLNP